MKLAWFAIPWEQRHLQRAIGMLLMKAYLVQARNVGKVIEHADSVLIGVENREGTTELDGAKVDLKRLGIFDIRLITDELKSGAEIAVEIEENIAEKKALLKLWSPKDRQDAVTDERIDGRMSVLPVTWTL